LSIVPSHQRSREPRLPPREIATIDFHIDLSPSRCVPLRTGFEQRYAFPRGPSVGIISR
jgi:hypothetical protein